MQNDLPPDFSAMTRREIEDYLVERSMVDGAFRRRLLNEPEVLLRELGLPVGDGVNIRVLEEEPKAFFLVLPRAIRELEEMDEAELDAVAGGLGRVSSARRFFQGYL